MRVRACVFVRAHSRRDFQVELFVIEDADDDDSDDDDDGDDDANDCDDRDDSDDDRDDNRDERDAAAADDDDVIFEGVFMSLAFRARPSCNASSCGPRCSRRLRFYCCWQHIRNN